MDLRKRISDLEIAICELLVASDIAEIMACIAQFRVLMRPEHRV